MFALSQGGLRTARAADSAAAQLSEQSSLIFRGTVQQIQTATQRPSEPKVQRETVVVNQVISLADGARQALGDLTGKTVNIVDSSGARDPLKVGDQWTFYTNGLQDGDSITLEAIGRVKS